MAKIKLADRRNAQENDALQREINLLRDNLAAFNDFIDLVVEVTDSQGDSIEENAALIKELKEENAYLKKALDDLKTVCETREIVVNIDNNTKVEGNSGDINQDINSNGDK